MRRVLVIHPGPASFRQRQVREHRNELEALGVELVLADDFVTSADRGLFADTIDIPSPECVAESYAILERWCAAREVHAVLAQSEAGACVGSLVAAKLGVPALSPRGALLTTSKHLCRIELERAGVPQPRFARAHDAAGVRAFAREVGLPIVLKAHASALARLVTLVSRESEIDTAVERLLAMLPQSSDVKRLVSFARAAGFDLGGDPAREFLVEEFARGDAVETDGIVYRERIETFGVVEQVLSKPPWFFLEGYLVPAERPEQELARIEAVSDAALRALGVANTGFSIEMRCSGGETRVIEVNGRLGWDEGFGDLFARITGAQPSFQALAIALGLDPRVERRRDAHAALAYQCRYEDGVVAQIPSAADLARLEREHGAQLGLAVWAEERIHAPPHPDATPHVAWALSTHGHSSRAAYATARRAVDRVPLAIL